MLANRILPLIANLAVHGIMGKVLKAAHKSGCNLGNCIYARPSREYLRTLRPSTGDSLF